MVNNSADLTSRMRRMICTFVIHKQENSFPRGVINQDESAIVL